MLKAWRRLPLIVRVAAVLLLLVGLYGALGGWVVPRVARPRVEQLLGERLGRAVHLERIELNPFTLTVDILGLRIEGRPGEGDLLALEHLYADLRARPLVTGEVLVDELLVQGLALRVQVDPGGALEFQELLARFAATAPEGEKAPLRDAAAGKPLVLDVAHVGLQRVRIELVDRSRAVPARLALDPLTLELSELGTRPGNEGRFTLAVGLPEGGSIAATGTLSLQPFAARLDLRLAGLPLARLDAFLDGRAPLAIADGRLGASAPLALGPDGALSIEGASLTLDGLSVGPRAASGPPAEPWLSLQAFALHDVDVDLAARACAVGSLALRGPTARLALDADGRLAPPGWPASAADASPVEAPDEATVAPARWSLALDALRIEGGTLTFTESGPSPPVTRVIDALDLRVDGFSTAPASEATVLLTARVDGAPLRLETAFLPADPARRAQVEFSLHGLDLVHFTPHSGRWIGREIAQGRLSLDVNARVEDGALVAGNLVDVDRLGFGADVESAEATGLPVGLAVALLQDDEGRIRLDLPVEGRVDAPGFRYGRLVLDALLGVVTRAVSAPFRFLAGLVGLDAEAPFDALVFAPGSDELAAPSAALLDQLAPVLVERPALRVSLRGRASAARDGAALGAGLLHERAVASGLLPPGSAPADADGSDAALRALYQRVLGRDPDELLAGLVALHDSIGQPLAPERRAPLLRQAMTDSLVTALGGSDAGLENLARRRAQVVADRLQAAGVPLARLVTVEPELVESHDDEVGCALALDGA